MNFFRFSPLYTASSPRWEITKTENGSLSLAFIYSRVCLRKETESLIYRRSGFVICLSPLITSQLHKYIYYTLSCIKQILFEWRYNIFRCVFSHWRQRVLLLSRGTCRDALDILIYCIERNFYWFIYTRGESRWPLFYRDIHVYIRVYIYIAGTWLSLCAFVSMNLGHISIIYRAREGCRCSCCSCGHMLGSLANRKSHHHCFSIKLRGYFLHRPRDHPSVFMLCVLRVIELTIASG